MQDTKANQKQKGIREIKLLKKTPNKQQLKQGITESGAKKKIQTVCRLSTQDFLANNLNLGK